MSHFACKAFSALEKELKDDLLECYVEAQQEIEDIINSIESEGFSFDKLDNLFRSLHSMKGNCSVCFLDPLVGVLHKLEEIVDGMRGGYIQYHPNLGELIIVVIEKVYDLLQQIYQSHVAEVAVRDQLQQGLDSIYAEEEDGKRPEMAAALLIQCSRVVEEVKEEPIVEEVEKREMPIEIALLPIVESAFDPFGYSNRSASGIWQFMPATGERFDLKQNWWYDGRRDIVQSTRAALDYLSYLHKTLEGDWLNAIAAYNSGETAVERYGKTVPPFPETQEYVRRVKILLRRYKQNT